METIATAPASLVFNENSKTAIENELVFRPQNNTAVMLRANLYLADSINKMVDGTFAEFNNNFSADINYEDALKFGNINETFSMERKGYALTAERMPEINENDTLFYKLTKTTARKYRIEFIADGINHSEFEGFVEDTYLNTKTPVNLSGTTNVDFSIISGDAASAASNRFRIVFKPALNPLLATFTSVKAYEQNTGINVEWKVENETSIKHYEVEKSLDGRTFTTEGAIAARNNSNVSQSYKLFDAQPNKGDNYYRIKSIGIDGENSYSVIVRVIVQNKMMIVVYPNPIKGNSLELKFTNTVAGKYSLSLYSDDGKKIFTKKINVSTEINTLAIPVHTLAHGIYQLQIINSNSSKATITLKVIVG